MFDVPHRVRLKVFYAAFRPDRLITFAWRPGDVPRGIIADIIEDLGINRDDFYFRKF
jgi:hypothetical protein